MDIVYCIFAVLFIALSLFVTFLRVRDFYYRYHEVTGKGFLNYFFSSDCCYHAVFTDENYDKLKQLSKEKGVSIDLLLNHIVSSLDYSKGDSK